VWTDFENQVAGLLQRPRAEGADTDRLELKGKVDSHVIEWSENSGMHNLAQSLVRRKEKHVVANAQAYSITSGRFFEFIGLFCRKTHRFFYEDVDSEIESEFRQRVVPIRRDQQMNGVGPLISD
jgi:hypothetical protein